jgi:YD repeat-containing protein
LFIGPVTAAAIYLGLVSLVSASSRSTTYAFDPSTILLTSATDADNNITTAFAYDSLGRLTNSEEALGTSAEHDHLITYHDDTLRITNQQDLYQRGDLALTNVIAYDQLGRVRLTKQLELAGPNANNDSDGVKVETRYAYESGASYKLVSNPFRAATSTSSTESTMGWTLLQADTDGRQVSSAKFGGGALPAPFGGNGSSTGTATTVYTATSAARSLELTTSKDEAGNPRTTGADGLGRLIQVIENPTSTTTYSTTYSYDLLDDLLNVNQEGQVRVFGYDSVKRLTGATNPETYSANSVPSEACAGGVYTIC